jgi:hypothetical protein
MVSNKVSEQEKTFQLLSLFTSDQKLVLEIASGRRTKLFLTLLAASLPEKGGAWRYNKAGRFIQSIQHKAGCGEYFADQEIPVYFAVGGISFLIKFREGAFPPGLDKKRIIAGFRFFELGQNCPVRSICMATKLARLHAGGLPTVRSTIPPPAWPSLRWADPLW